MHARVPHLAPVDAALLERFALTLDAALDPAEPAPPFAVGITCGDDGVELSTRPLHGPDPIGSLVGYVAPPHWYAFGVACTGRARHLDTGTEQGRAAVVHLRSRSGQRVETLRLSNAAPAVTVSDGPPVSGTSAGRVDDLVARAMGLPTAAASLPVGELWSRLWLDRLIAACFAVRPPSSWTAAAAYHPAVDLWEPRDAAALQWATDHLDDLAGAINDWSWASVHEQAIHDLLPADLAVDPERARWFDVGSFSRDVLAPFLGPDTALVELADHLPDPVLRAIEAALRRWAC